MELGTPATTEATTTTATTPAADEQKGTATEPAKATENSGNNVSNLEKLIQQAVDRATNKLGNENKKLRGEIEKLQKASMDADELRNFELSEKEKAIADREKALTEKENRLIAIKAIKEAGLDDGSDASLAIVDFVMADSKEGIKERVKAFDALVKRIVQTKVDGVFKQNGRTPGVGTDANQAGEGKKESVATKLGRSTAAANKTAQSVLDHYIGGRKA